MTELQRLELQNAVLKKQNEYLLLRRKQQKSLSKLERDYNNRKVMILADEKYLLGERFESYLLLCEQEAEVRLRVIHNHVKQIDKFRRDNIDFWNSILELKF